MSNQPHEGGQFGEIYTEDDFLAAVKRLQPVGTQEVADAVGCSRQNADYRLRQLDQDDKVDGKKIGNSLAWTVSTEEA